MNGKLKMVTLSAMVMVGLMAAGAISAQTVGGGVTLPEPLYDALLPSGVGSFDFTYTGTGSGAGKKAFLNNNPQATADSEFRDESLAARPIWPTTQSVHFVGSDSLLTSAEKNSYNNDNFLGTSSAPKTRQQAWGPLIQIPTVATAVLIPYKSSTISAVTDLNLSDAKMCAVFSQKTGGRTWGEVLGTTDNTPVQVVYQADDSGTTELLSRYLVAACWGSGFVVSNSFAAVVAGALPSGTTLASTGWRSVKGDGGMSSSFGGAGRIGYMSPDPAYNPSGNTRIAKVNGFLPVAASIKNALGAQSLPLGNAANDPQAWVPAYIKPPVSGSGASYPIFGTTNLLINQCYANATAQSNIMVFLGDLYSSSLVGTHGFVDLPDGTNGTNDWRGAIVSTFMDSASSLGIGNTNVCNGIGRP